MAWLCLDSLSLFTARCVLTKNPNDSLNHLKIASRSVLLECFHPWSGERMLCLCLDNLRLPGVNYFKIDWNPLFFQSVAHSLLLTAAMYRPADTRRWINVSLTLVQRRTRWTNVKPTLFQSLVSAGRIVLCPVGIGAFYRPCSCNAWFQDNGLYRVRGNFLSQFLLKRRKFMVQL